MRCRAEVIDELLQCGWSHHQTFPRWEVFCKHRPGCEHYYNNPAGLIYITVFRNGRTAKGHINP